MWPRLASLDQIEEQSRLWCRSVNAAQLLGLILSFYGEGLWTVYGAFDYLKRSVLVVAGRILPPAFDRLQGNKIHQRPPTPRDGRANLQLGIASAVIEQPENAYPQKCR